jgi:hypothetical protein
LGLFCSLSCLSEASATSLAEGEDHHASRLGLPSHTEAERSRTRLIDRAQVLLERGAGLRETGDELGVSTKTLARWLEQAGYHPQPAVEGKSPVAAVNELTQAGHLHDVSYHLEATGPAHAREFTCTLTVHQGTANGEDVRLTGHGTGRGKQPARANAAADLLAHLNG